jgi:hypothetical protein
VGDLAVAAAGRCLASRRRTTETLGLTGDLDGLDVLPGFTWAPARLTTLLLRLGTLSTRRRLDGILSLYSLPNPAYGGIEVVHAFY